MKIKQNLYPQDPLVNARVEARKSNLAKDASAVSVRLVKAGVVQMENRPGDIAQKDKNLERMLAFGSFLGCRRKAPLYPSSTGRSGAATCSL